MVKKSEPEAGGKKIQITRRIQLFINLKGKELTEAYTQLNNWNYIIRKTANYTASHHYIMQNIGDFFYLHDDLKIKFLDRTKVQDGVLTTSKDNTTYQLASKKFKGSAPMGMVSAMNNNVSKNVSREFNDYARGDKALRTYRKDVPMPTPVNLFRRWGKTADGNNYTFELFSVPFRTNFSFDHQNNKLLLEMALAGEYALCESAIQVKKGKIFLLAVFEFQKEAISLDKDVIMTADLSIDVPIVCSTGKKNFEIGTKEEFLHRRIQIQESRRRAQISATYNTARDGRKLKLQAVDRFAEMEKNYVKTRMHTYSARLIKYCIDHRCGTLILKDQKVKEEEAKLPENKMILRNWGYHGLIDLIRYKAKMAGIELVVE